MLKKLLKYDFNAIFKYWWIGALTTFILSFAGAACQKIIYSPKDIPDSVYTFATLGIMLVVFSFVAFALMTALLVYIRFFKHLFSDEGYLTFTLPVKRNDIVNSKLIVGSFSVFVTAAVTAINTCIMLSPVLKEDVFYKGWEKDFEKTVNALVATHGILNLVIEAIEIVAIVILCILLITVFAYLCITIGCIVAKKAKLVVSIGIYYASCIAVIVCGYLYIFFGYDALYDWINKLPGNQENEIFPFILLLIVLILLMLCTMMYALINWLIDRKLNLN